MNVKMVKWLFVWLQLSFQTLHQKTYFSVFKLWILILQQFYTDVKRGEKQINQKLLSKRALLCLLE